MDELIGEFIAETSESLSVLDLELVKLEQNPNDPDLLSSIFRLMHTIKGTCGFLGLQRLEKVAHAAENVLGKVRDGELVITPDAISLILESIDSIKSLLEHLKDNGAEPEGSDADLIGRLNQCAEGGGGGAPSSHTPEETAHEEQSIEQAKQEAVEEGLKIVAESAPEPQPQPQAEQSKEAKPSGGAAVAPAQSIRVNLDVLENLMQMVSELVLTRNQLLQMMRSRNDTEFANPLQRLSLITTELQEGIMKTRMQPIGSAWSKFPRLIRDLSLELGKKIDLKMIGEETELDRQLLELIKDPLTHMVRNSADHAIERPDERKAAGKSETGTITLYAYHEGGHIIIEISDDGRGLNVEKIKAKAIGNGLTTESEFAKLSDQQIFQFIFKAGFSTAEKVTSVSGRGVGMDVVRTNIEKMGGSIDLTSKTGKGSTFKIKIPLTLAIMPVLIVEAKGEKFAIPQINVLELVRAAPGSEYWIETIDETPVLRLRGRLLPLVSLGQVLGLNSRPNLSGKMFVVVCEVGSYTFGVIVDKVFDTEEIVVKPVSPALKSISLYSGSTILGDGSVIMILDPNGLSKSSGNLNADSNAKPEAKSKTFGEDQPVSFLVFKAGGTATPKAVPLELVSRLEEIEAQHIEIAGDFKIVQYRNDLMKLVTLDGCTLDTSNPSAIYPVIVFSDEDKTLGLVVEEIADIVDQPMNLKMESMKDGYLGSMVIHGKATDVIDVGWIISQEFKTWRKKGGHAENAEIKTEKILLVEDSPFFRKMMVPVLMSKGYMVDTAPGGKEAVETLEKNGKYDLIITDIDMPGMNGLQFAAVCKSDNKFKSIPIIALSSNTSPEVMEEGKRIGMIAHVAKADRDKLFEVVGGILAGKTARMEAQGII